MRFTPANLTFDTMLFSGTAKLPQDCGFASVAAAYILSQATHLLVVLLHHHLNLQRVIPGSY